jgi:hypothetical protein
MAWHRDSRAAAGALGSFIHDPVADAELLMRFLQSVRHLARSACHYGSRG